MLYMIVYRWLDSRTNSWHRHNTKWHKTSDAAWDEKEKFEKSLGEYCLESSAAITTRRIINGQ